MIRAAIVGTGTTNARAISSVVRPAIIRRVSATRASGDEHRVAGGEHQPQHVVVDGRLELDLIHRIGGSSVGSEVAADQLDLALERHAAADRVDAAAPGDRHEPGARVVRHAGLRPLLERGHERVLREVLGQPDVANDTDQAGDDPRGLHPPDRLDGPPDGGLRPRIRHCWRAATSSRSFCSDACSSGVRLSPKSSASKIGRTSTSVSWNGERLSHSTASSIEATSQTQ